MSFPAFSSRCLFAVVCLAACGVPLPVGALQTPVRGEALPAARLAEGVTYGPALTPSVGSNWTVSPPEFLCGSVDGEGLDEMVTVERVSDVLARVWIAQPGDGAHRLDRSVIYPPAGVARLGDVNGDQRQDLVLFYRNAFGGAEAGDVMVCPARTDGLGFGAAVKWHEYFGINDETPLVADFDGDGRADLVTLFNGGAGSVFGALSTGADFGPGTEWATGIAPAGHQAVAADLNGDGAAELIVTTFTSSQRTYQLFGFSSGGGGGSLTPVGESGPYVRGGRSGERLVAGDINGDAREDIYSVPSLAGTVREAVSAWLGTTLPAGQAGLAGAHAYTPTYDASAEGPPVYYVRGRLNPDFNDDLLTVVILPAIPPSLPTPSANFSRRLAGDPSGSYGPWMDLVNAGSPHVQGSFFTAQGHFPAPPANPVDSGFASLRVRWLDQSRTWRDGPVIPRASAQSSITTVLPPEAEVGTFATLTGPLRITFRVVQVVNNMGPFPTTTDISANVIGILGMDPYKAWAASHFIHFEYYADDDPDHDGLSNAMEFLLGTGPFSPTAAEDGNPEVFSAGDRFVQRCTLQPLYTEVPVHRLLGLYPRFDFHFRYLPERAARFPWVLQNSMNLGAWSGTSFWTNTTWTSDQPWSDSPVTFRVEEAGTSFYVAHVEEFATDPGVRPQAFRRLKLRLSNDLIRPPM